jgi:hypothetical protein
VSAPGSDLSLRYRDVARSVAARLSLTPRSLSAALPQINIRNS